jgi:hypothetical protein
MSESDMAEWHTAWANIQDDYKSGVITKHQFLKEQDYMREGRRHIEKRSLSLTT